MKSNFKKLYDLIGTKAYNALRNKKAHVRVWQRTIP